MPRVRRTAAVLAVALAAAACTDDPAPRTGAGPALLGAVDLAAAVAGDARLLDLAPVPGGNPVALLGDGDARAWLVEVGSGEDGPVATTLLELPAVGEDAELAVLPGGAFLVATTSPAAGYQLLTVPPDGQATVTSLGLRPVRAATALSPDGRTLHAALALPDGGPGQLLAVDLAAGVVTMTAPVVPEGTVTALAARPDGGVAALVETADDRALLTGYDADLRPDGEPVDLAPDAAAAVPADLEVTGEGTAVATVRLGPGLGRLLTVADGAVTGEVGLDGVGDSALDVVVPPDGRTAVLARSSAPAELVTVDLASGQRIEAVPLCPDAGVLRELAPVGTDGGLLATGSCAGGAPVTGFLVG